MEIQNGKKIIIIIIIIMDKWENFENINVYYYRMNYLDLLPDNVLNIMNRKVKKLHIIERRIERKRNKKINREQN